MTIKTRGVWILAAVMFFAVSQIAPLAHARATRPTRADNNLQNGLAEEVRHQLVMIPFLTVFDNLAYSVNGGEVTLTGEVTDGAVRDNAVSAVKGIEGVTKVINDIQLLPVSQFDDQIRRAEFRAIYGFPALEKYATGAWLQIHILVSNGHVRLEGVVLNQADKDIAGIRAKSVPNVFSVTNNLQISSK